MLLGNSIQVVHRSMDTGTGKQTRQVLHTQHRLCHRNRVCNRNRSCNRSCRGVVPGRESWQSAPECEPLLLVFCDPTCCCQMGTAPACCIVPHCHHFCHIHCAFTGRECRVGRQSEATCRRPQQLHCRRCLLRMCGWQRWGHSTVTEQTMYLPAKFALLFKAVWPQVAWHCVQILELDTARSCKVHRHGFPAQIKIFAHCTTGPFRDLLGPEVLAEDQLCAADGL